MAKSLTKDAVSISIALSKPAEGVSQGVYMVNDRQKLPLILDILKDIQGQRIIIFSSTKQGVNTLFQQLKAKRLNVESVSSDLDQEKRESVMLAFRNSQVDIIVATDVLSRGIDIDGIDMVINYDIPRDAEDYVHRIGRTARAQRKGAALTLVSTADLRSFKKIEQLIGKEVPRLPLPPHVEAMKNDPVRDNRRPAEKSVRQPAADNRTPRPGQPQRTNARPNQPDRPTAQPSPPERLQSRLPQPDPKMQATNNTDPNKAKRPKRRKPRPKPRPIPTNEMDQDID